MKNKTLFGLIFCLFSTVVAAQSRPSDAPLHIQSEKWDSDLKARTVTYLNNVKVTQGTMSIEADSLFASAADGKGKEILIAKGNPARFSHVLDDNIPISASANEIRYDVAKRILTLQGNAAINQDGSEMRGETIQYDLTKQTISANSGKPSEQVHTIFSQETSK